MTAASRTMAVVTGKHGLVSLFLAIVVAVLLWAWLTVRSPDTFPIKRVRVMGEYTHEDPKKIQEIVAPLVSKGLFSTDLTAISQDLQRLPWVKQAVVTRVWPDQIHIAIHEKIPVAIIDDHAFITEQGEVVYPEVSSLPKNLPVFLGPVNKAQQLLQAYQEFSAILRPLDLHILELQLTSGGTWSVRLNNGSKVVIGDEEMSLRLRRFVSVYSKIFKDHMADTVDLRYPHGLAVKWQ